MHQSRAYPLLLVLTIGAVAIASVGCDAPTIGLSQNMATLNLPNANGNDVFMAMEASIREQGFRIADADEVRGYIRSAPNEAVIEGGTGRLSDEVLKPKNNIRRIAEAQVSGRDNGVTVRYRVTVERLDTEKYRVWRQAHTVSDIPSESPIDDDKALTPEQNETWTFVRRDSRLEAAIRLALLERLGRENASTAETAEAP